MLKAVFGVKLSGVFLHKLTYEFPEVSMATGVVWGRGEMGGVFSQVEYPDPGSMKTVTRANVLRPILFDTCSLQTTPCA